MEKIRKAPRFSPIIEPESLHSLSPALAQEWHPSKNGRLTPQEINARACKTVWWLCPNGHSYEKWVQYRTVRGYGCPICSGRKVSKDNCLKTVNPNLAKEWHPTRNGNMTPKDVTRGSTKAVWWRCENGHEWRTKISIRSHGTGCPHCPRKPKAPEKSLMGLNPVLAKQWHPDKNGTLLPGQISGGSSWKAWWRCPKGHEWEASIADRCKNDKGCPICLSRAATLKNCLMTTYPTLAKEWDSAKNRLTPRDVTADSLEVVWWICKEGHAWRSMVAMRTKDGLGCPECGGTGS